MKLRTRLTTALVAVSMSGIVFASSAAAVEPDIATARSEGSNAVAAGPLLMWEDPNYTGDLYVAAYPSDCPKGCDIDGWDGDNEISSAKNQTTCTVRLYDNDGFTGSYVDLGAGRNYSDLKLVGFDNRAESYKFFCG
ncbi:peptidase inhibitor family I36 protein [Kribbella speibonae]|uniref:Peptidase inhibitor family I36 n=1 Tax=Kribbella speibonae TaxID=1572660 RepID=A0ABY2AEG6_9ACTN|nr:peptidase inhibitor family I36 protein [Kribbella speibonae]TCC26696.1 hypothetical protein E0H58_01305 [Kribbella speibonae]